MLKSRSTVTELIAIFVVMVLNSYPALEMTRIIRLYVTTWKTFDPIFEAELIWCIWFPYFFAPMFLAFVFWILEEERENET